MWSEYPPCVAPEPSRSTPLYVWVQYPSQNTSSPALHCSQAWHESTMQPTPTMSPTLNFVTSAPTAVTSPTISWPGTIGYTEFFHSLRAWCISDEHTPQYLMSILTSLERSARRLKLKGSSGVVALWAA